MKQSLGPANDTPAVLTEIRAAEIAADPELRMTQLERRGWETARGAEQRLASSAGWLAYQIFHHGTGDWVFSTNDEEWNGGERCDSREEAIGEAPIYFGLGAGDSFWTGRATPLTAVRLAMGAPCADQVLEQLDTWLYDNYGDIQIDADKLTQADHKELDDAIEGLVASWLAEHDLVPKWFNVEDVQRHIVEVTASDG